MATVTAPLDRSLHDLVGHCLPVHSLPRRFYVDPGMFAADLDAVFRRHWLLAGQRPAPCRRGRSRHARPPPGRPPRGERADLRLPGGESARFRSHGRRHRRLLRAPRLEHTRVARRTVDTIHANWKVVAENFWECYHCAPSHPEFCDVMSYAHAANSERLAAERESFERQWEEETRTRGGKTGRAARTAAGLHQGGRIPIRPGYRTQSRDGRPVAPLLGAATEYDGGVTSFMHLPLVWYLVCNDHAMLTRFTPRSPLETELELTWLVRADAVEGQDFDPAEVSWLWSVTAAQDKKICADNQRGILSGRYQPGPLAKTEASVAAFHAWYLGELAAVPENARCC